MKAAICYCSRHHGNTKKVVEAMAAAGDVTLIDILGTPAADLAPYDCVGLASGIYGFEVDRAAVEFARANLPAGKPVFFVYTYGGARGTGAKALEAAAAGKGCPVLGQFSCRGFTTFGPFRLVGGIGKGLPDSRDLEQAQAFYQGIENALAAR